MKSKFLVLSSTMALLLCSSFVAYAQSNNAFTIEPLNLQQVVAPSTFSDEAGIAVYTKVRDAQL